MTRAKRSKLRFVWYVLFNLTVVIAVNRVVHWRWLGKLRAHAPAPWQTLAAMAERNRFPLDVAASVGIANRDARDDLSLRPLAHPGWIRIGALGDSFTYGEEVLPGRDYPSRLEERFRRAGFNNVEVLNFGTGWIGLSQIALIWERLAQKYNLDFVLLGPEGFYLEREETFNHAVDAEPYYIHGRFILDGDGVRFVDPAGADTFEDRFEQYFAFIPRWRYLRYDRRAPAFLQSWLPGNKVLSNPFYYTSDSQETERDKIYRALFARFERGARQTIVLDNEPGVYPLMRDAGPKLASLEISLPYDFPYRRPRGHLDGTANDYLASIFFDLLTGRAASDPELIALVDLPAPPPDPQPLVLTDYWRIEAHIGGQLAGYLVHQHPAGGFGALDSDGVVEPDVEKIHSLVVLRGSKSVLNEAFFSIPTPLPEGAKLELEGTPRRTLGVVKRLAGEPALAFVDVPGFNSRCFAQAICIYDSAGPLKDVQTGVLLIDGKPRFNIKRVSPEELTVTPIELERLLLSPLSTTRVDLAALPASGDATLEFIGAKPRSLRVAAFSRRVVHHQTRPAARFIRASGTPGVATVAAEETKP